MDVFFDPTVLIAASEQSHPHHTQARPALLRVAAGKDKGFIGAHSIAEVYAGLTRLPVQPRIHPTEATRILNENILPHFEVVPVGKKDYLDAVNAMGDGGWIGAKIYDALLLLCAAKCNATRIYTFNLADFRQLAPDNFQEKICLP
jgi:predicted nucleic acid-binding protein